MDDTGSTTNKGFFRSRKRVFSFCLVVLAVSFSVIMLRGQNQTRMYKIHKWFDPGARYETSNVEDTGNDRAVQSLDKVSHSDGGYNMVRSDDRLDSMDDHFKAIPDPDLYLEGASNGEAPSREGAVNTETEPSAPVSALNLPIKQDLGTEGVMHDVKSVPRNKYNDLEGALYPGTRQVPSIDGAINTVTKLAIQRKGALFADSKQSMPVVESIQDLQKMSTNRVPFRRKVSVATRYQTTESFISPPGTTQAVYYDICERCCYRYTTIDHDILKALNETELKERGCRQRLPDAMIFGVKKGGTTTLKNFLSYHPDIAFTQKELKFFTSPEERAKGMAYYRSRMIHSTPDQISMEKTPAYSHYPKVPGMIKKVLPNIKLIIIMRDPVDRAVSDFVHMQVTIAKRCQMKPLTFTQTSMLRDITIPEGCNYSTRYEINHTFEESVIDSTGRVKADSQLISKGIYVQEIQRYLKYFKPAQILAIDGETFIKDPYPAVKLVEQFLGIRDYFTRDHFYYDVQKGFFCMNKPIPQNCMSPAKGRPHPEVREDTLQKLRDFYRPYNEKLRHLVNLDLHWSS
ncbi:uncharacterized protein LOC119724679 [Patiria miniata]|uniref:Sulfotransferase domain-containing protein n=1 Tax=Patiria miniata TaxID=46514 RepID=A0A913ZIZ1_PATMI|nr:uncharacterized protein LOC119724679 [Patiria miniata]